MFIMTSKEMCPNALVFSTYANGMVISRKQGFNHILHGFSTQLINNVCPNCPFNEVCLYKEELLTTLNNANENRKALSM